MLKIGFMDYANVFPIFYYLLKDKNLSFIKGFPSQLNDAMRNKTIDISPASSIEFARNYNMYNIISDICISSIGAVKSVNLYSNYSINELHGKKVYFTKESNTSTVLCRIVLEKFYNINPIYTDNLEECDCRLLIGDKALFEYYNSSYKHIIDLGEEWYNKTALPFVFALWLTNKDILSNEEFYRFKENLIKTANIFPKDLDRLLPKYIEQGYTKEELDDYWNTIIYTLTDKHIDGLKLFYQYAFDLGECKTNPSNILDNSFI